ncbi:hypothetical protein [Streptomyces rhizosphaericus]|uniref:hypothetical protein n=1 Tax=Streptomyces rhizosphaericus TaxID=114699 RepID=UPI003642EF0D
MQVSLPVVGDPIHPPRTGYVFRLLPEAGTPAPEDVPAAPPLKTETAIIERDLAPPSARSPEPSEDGTSHPSSRLPNAS